jgi:hypothetical protein
MGKVGAAGHVAVAAGFVETRLYINRLIDYIPGPFRNVPAVGRPHDAGKFGLTGNDRCHLDGGGMRNGEEMSDEILDPKPEITELNEDQLSGVQGGQGISVVVKQKAITSIPKTSTGGSIAQGDTLDGSLLEDGLPS